jgi:ABC-type proline/glycine betaine transport system permease subunit
MTGLLLTYCQLTDNWDSWIYLWIFEVWALVISILIPIWVGKNKTFAQGISRPMALILSVASIAMIALIGLYVGMDTVIAWIEGFTRAIVP